MVRVLDPSDHLEFIPFLLSNVNFARACAMISTLRLREYWLIKAFLDKMAITVIVEGL